MEFENEKIESLNKNDNKENKNIDHAIYVLNFTTKTANTKWHKGMETVISRKTRIGYCVTYLRENWIRCCAIFCGIIVFYVGFYPVESVFLSVD